MSAVTLSISGGDKMAKVLAGIAERMTKAESVRVGFLEDASYPVNAANSAPDLHVAQVAFWNEFGTSRALPRPFFRQMIAAKSPKWGEALGKIAVATNYDSDKTLNLMGEGIKGQLQQSINQFTSPANAASTVARKGFDKPLIDTGTMLRAVDYEVKSA